MEDDFYYKDESFQPNYPKRIKKKISDKDKSHITKKSIYDYLVLCKRSSTCYKLAGLITNKQIVMQVSRGDLDDHWSMITKVNQAIFPTRKYNHSYLYEKGIEVYSVGYDLHININGIISLQQYKLLLDIIEQVKRFEEEYGTKVEYFDADILLKDAKENISNSFCLEPDEKLAGVPFSEELLMEPVIKEINLEGCNNMNDVKEAGRKVAKFYKDDVLKNVITKICPSCNKIVDIIKKINDSLIITDENVLVQDVTFNNIYDYLENYYISVKKNEDGKSNDNNIQDNEEFIDWNNLTEETISFDKQIEKIYYNHHLSMISSYINYSSKSREDYQNRKQEYLRTLDGGNAFDIDLSKELLKICYDYKNTNFKKLNDYIEVIQNSQLTNEHKNELIELIISELNNYYEWKKQQYSDSSPITNEEFKEKQERHK